LPPAPEAGLAGMIADNGIDSRVVFGPGVSMSCCPDPGWLWIAVNVNAVPVAAGAGNRVPGAPVASLCWPVNGPPRAGFSNWATTRSSLPLRAMARGVTMPA